LPSNWPKQKAPFLPAEYSELVKELAEIPEKGRAILQNNEQIKKVPKNIKML
jgi:hypothetical protein